MLHSAGINYASRQLAREKGAHFLILTSKFNSRLTTRIKLGSSVTTASLNQLLFRNNLEGQTNIRGATNLHRSYPPPQQRHWGNPRWRNNSVRCVRLPHTKTAVSSDVDRVKTVAQQPEVTEHHMVIRKCVHALFLRSFKVITRQPINLKDAIGNVVTPTEEEFLSQECSEDELHRRTLQKTSQ